LRILQSDNWISKDNKLTDKAIELINQFDELLYCNKKKAVIKTLGTDAQENVNNYRELWDMGKLPSGSLARVNAKDLETTFIRFFQMYKYDWDTIIKATKHYINEYSLKSPRYMYMQNSKYFIMKQVNDKTWTSSLADYCELVLSGDTQDLGSGFTENVV
jgi:hypothetical protein